MEQKIFEIKMREWKDDPEALLEDSVQGEWRYIPITALLSKLKGNHFLMVCESEEGIKLAYAGEPDFYFLSGRREDWQKDWALEEFEVIKKVDSVREWSGQETKFGEPRYIDYGVIGLYTPEHRPLIANEGGFPAGIRKALEESVNELAGEYLQEVHYV